MSAGYTGGGTGSSGPVNIPEVMSDPVAPIAGAVWVLHNPSDIGGNPIGLLLALTYTIGAGSYTLSYQTLAGTVVRRSLVIE